MVKETRRKRNKTGVPDVHPDLKGFEIKINELGAIETTIPIDDINSFLEKEEKKIKKPKSKQ